MPRKRPPNRLDQIADAATLVFIDNGYAAARVADVAARARVGPGTVYLYAESKEALLDLAVRRALEDPSVFAAPLPHPTPAPGAVADALWRCLHNAATFPQLWLAAESPSPDDLRGEVAGVISELYDWLVRYRRAVKLVERCAGDWPDLAQVFYSRFWRGGVRRIADYLSRRHEAGAIELAGDALTVAHLVVETLAWAAVHRVWSPEASGLKDEQVRDSVVALLVAGICGETT